jgi:hypothetical protein
MRALQLVRLMNRKKTIKNEFAPNKVCPVTGLRVLQRPEWTDVSLSKACRVTLSVVGDNVLLVRSVGYAALDDVRGTVALIRRVVTGSNRQGSRNEFTI